MEAANGVMPLKPRYLNIVGACLYTSKTPDQLRHAERNDHLRVVIAKDGSKSYRTDDLDEYMNAQALIQKKSK